MAPPEAFSVTEKDINAPRSQTVLITGGASGIGLATAALLHNNDNNVVVLDRASQPPSIEGLTSSSRYQYISCDITSWTQQRNAFASALKRFGRIDCVFVNAGLPEHGDQMFDDKLDDTGELAEPDRRTIDVDIRAVGDTLKLAMYHMRNDRENQNGGSIVMTASLAGYLASTGAPLYSAAKHGVVGYLRAMKSDAAKLGIAMSVIAPGITLTPIILGRREGQSLSDWGKEMSDLGVPINDAESVARVVAWLMGKGSKANGFGILIQGNKCSDLEFGYATSRKEWMGDEMLKLFKGGRNAPLFPNKL